MSSKLISCKIKKSDIASAESVLAFCQKYEEAYIYYAIRTADKMRLVCLGHGNGRFGGKMFITNVYSPIEALFEETKRQAVPNGTRVWLQLKKV